MLILALFPYKCAIQGFQVIFVYTFIYPSMYKKHLFYLTLCCLTAFSCATVPLPLATIPQKGNTAMAAVSAGWNGANVQAAYAANKYAVLSLSFQQWGWIPKEASHMLDASIGIRAKRGDLMALVSFGRGKQYISPISNGLAGRINYQYGDVTRWSGYFIARLSPFTFLNFRISSYKGMFTYRVNGSIYSGRSFSEDISTIGAEPALFGKFGGFTCGVGAHLMFDDDSKVRKTSFRPWMLWFVIGFKLGKKW